MELGPRFARFRAIVLDDPALQRRLRELGEWTSFAETAVEAAAEHGIELGIDQLEELRRRAQLDWLAR